jgi:hypothetical protein
MKHLEKAAGKGHFKHTFESYGVIVCLSSNDKRLLDDAIAVAERSLIGNLKARGPVNDEGAQHFELIRSSRQYYQVYLNGMRISSGPTRWKFLKFFDGLLRVTVGEHSPQFVFIHAGVVAWNGRALLLPANSFDGKSTLVTELVKLGAVYYSDEFAIVDKEGLVHPFARPINRRTDDGKFIPYEIQLDEIGGAVGSRPIRCGMLLLTRFEKGSHFSPRHLSKGEAILELVNFALSVRVNPEFTFRVLNNLLEDAILLSGRRPEAKQFAKRILDLIDKSGK